jgi:fused signal recognition particle receptor
LSDTHPQENAVPIPAENAGFFRRLRTRLTKTRKAISNGIDNIFKGKNGVDEDLLEDLEELLITSDIGVDTTMDLIQGISSESSNIATADQLKIRLKEEIVSLLTVAPPVPDPGSATKDKPYVIMVIGVNGVGKTTTIGKLAARKVKEGHSVLISAADTFRAAAIEQLTIWCERAGATMVRHKENSDPAAVVYDSIEAAIARDIDTVIIDTAGRLHTKVNLMEELKKIQRIVSSKIPGGPQETLLVLDATTGQNAISQAKVFDDALSVTGIALTKLDGTAKGGIVVSICKTLKIPLAYIGIGEKIEDLQDFDPMQFAEALFEASPQEESEGTPE